VAKNDCSRLKVRDLLVVRDSACRNSGETIAIYGASRLRFATTISFSSDPEHYVGRGKSITLPPEDATFDVQLSPNQGHLFVEVRVKNTTPLSFWLFHVMSPNGGATPLTPGTYETARDPLSPAWYFEFDGDGRGCNRATTHLVIHAVGWRRARRR
jgi:hypothetical protein